MAWTGNVARTERNGDQLSIIVSYVSDDGGTYDQTIITSSTQGDTWLSDQITAKLNQLNDLDSYQASVDGDAVLTATLSIDSSTQALAATPIKANPIKTGKV